MVNPVMRGGDVLVFSSGGFLSGSIEVWTRSILSHSAMVLDYGLPVDGAPQSEMHLIESTILNGRSGPQINPVAARLAGYDGRVWLLRLAERFRTFIDWTSLWDFAATRLHDHYAVIELAEYVLRKLPLVSYVPQLYRPIPHEEVCSELVAELLRAGGLPGLHPPLMPPQAIAELRIYESCSQLLGEPLEIEGFNTV